MPVKHIITQIKIAFLFLVLVIAGGMLGYVLIEGWSFFDALYMTIITITTTGYKEIYPLGHAGRLFTMILIVLGFVALAYTGGRMAQLFVEVYLFRRKRMNRKLQSIDNHYIVCGFGRMGKKICQELSDSHVTFVVIEKNKDEIENLRTTGFLYLEGDATTDEILISAGIKSAKGLVAVLPTEVENVFTTLSARVLNPAIFIVSRAVEEETESKLIKAGANRVVKPYEIGGYRMAQVLLRPGVIDFIDIIARDRQIDLRIDEIEVGQKSGLVGKTLADSLIRKELNIIIVAIFKKNGTVVYNPKSTAIIEGQDKLMVIGEENNIKKLIEIAGGRL